MVREKVVIRKSWRSEIGRVLAFLMLLVVSALLSQQFPGSIIEGPLFNIGRTTIVLALPLYWLLPLASFLDLVARVYNVYYVIDEQGIEAWDGILSLRQSITRIRHEDVRSIETDQSVLERILDVGEVSIGTAATGGVEVMLRGVVSPVRLQTWLQAERDEVQKRASKLASRELNSKEQILDSSVTSETGEEIPSASIPTEDAQQIEGSEEERTVKMGAL